MGLETFVSLAVVIVILFAMWWLLDALQDLVAKVANLLDDDDDQIDDAARLLDLYLYGIEADWDEDTWDGYTDEVEEWLDAYER